MCCRELGEGSNRHCFYSIPIHSLILDLVSFERLLAVKGRNLPAEVGFLM